MFNKYASMPGGYYFVTRSTLANLHRQFFGTNNDTFSVEEHMFPFA